eukprot:TRINITY_DN1900_c0_g2_i1.p1 TRINITY_DN1900_c0_g2~~TRINITY_DN1900_c0_g2_i1.p1  ORF type:complete len:756 (-),score=273.51 TRINITY_DN1900_c0_g2_i1:195-2462(-)
MPKKPDPVLELCLKLQEQVADLEKRVTNEVADVRDYCDQKVNEEVSKVADMLPGMREKAAADTQEVREMLPPMLQEQKELLTHMIELTEEKTKTNKATFDAFKTEYDLFLKKQEEVHAEHVARLVPLREALEQSVASLSDETKAQSSATEKRLDGIVEEQAAAMEEVAKAVDQVSELLEVRIEEVRKMFDPIGPRIDTVRSEAQNALMELAAAIEEEQKQLHVDLLTELQPPLMKEISDKHSAGMDEMKELHDSSQRQLDKVVAGHEDVIDKTVWRVDNMYTRFVTWRVPQFKKKTFALMRHEECYLLSPSFSVCTLDEMAMELQVKPQENLPPTVPFANTGNTAVAMPVPGMCSVRLWAPPGLRILFKLTFGEGSTGITRKYEHVFRTDSVPDDRGRVAFQAQNCCQLVQCWNRSADVAVFGFEVLEFSFEPTSGGGYISRSGTAACRQRQAALSYQAGAVTGGYPSAQTALSEDLAAPMPRQKTPSPEEEAVRLQREEAAQIAREEAEIAESLDEIVVGDPNGTGDIFVAKSVLSEQVLQDRLQKDLASYRNRNVRRVEWKVVGLQRLLDLCAPGQAVDSPLFQAAGLLGLQFHFYPKGSDPNGGGVAGDWCGLFVSGPEATTMHGTLWVGTSYKPFEHKFTRKGDAGGRNRFCNLEMVIGCDDNIMIALDITQVETELPDVQQSLCLRNKTTDGHNGHEVSHPTPVSGAKGLLKMKRQDPSKTEELARCVSLPTLDTRRSFLPTLKKQQRGA